MKNEKFISIFLMVLIITVLSSYLTPISSVRSQTVNLVKEEMLVLDPAFKKIIDAVVLGEMRFIKPALAEVHEAREMVEKAVKSGQKITLQKNQDKLKEFIELDDQFHEDIEVLLKAAGAGNKKVVRDQTHKLLNACVVCHERFKE